MLPARRSSSIPEDESHLKTVFCHIISKTHKVLVDVSYASLFARSKGLSDLLRTPMLTIVGASRVGNLYELAFIQESPV